MGNADKPGLVDSVAPVLVDSNAGDEVVVDAFFVWCLNECDNIFFRIFQLGMHEHSTG